MSKYETVGDGDILCIQDNAVFFLACCDCGLVHQIIMSRDIKKKENRMKFSVNGRRSYMMRKWMKERKQGIFTDTK